MVTHLFDFESISRNQVIDDMFEILKPNPVRLWT